MALRSTLKKFWLIFFQSSPNIYSQVCHSALKLGSKIDQPYYWRCSRFNWSWVLLFSIYSTLPPVKMNSHQSGLQWSQNLTTNFHESWTKSLHTIKDFTQMLYKSKRRFFHWIELEDLINGCFPIRPMRAWEILKIKYLQSYSVLLSKLLIVKQL